MLVGLVVWLVYEEPDRSRIFSALTLVFAGAGLIVFRLSRRKLKAQTLRIREGILSVTLCWVFAAVLCSFPYLLSGAHHSFIDAFFESTSCITTTSATLFEDLSLLPKSLLFWRQLTNWLGGLGIIIFAITVIPMLGFGAANLAGAESPVQSLENLQSRMTDTARYICLFFFTLTIVEILLLVAGGKKVYDAFLLSFASMGTGGFGNYQTEGLLEGDIYTEVIIGVFCLLSVLSFVSYRVLLKGRIRDFFKEIEIRLFLTMFAVVCVLVCIILIAYGTYEGGFVETVRNGIFQTISFTTTAGYSATDFDLWPKATHWILLAVMIVGGCSGSTSGGIKVVRAAVAFSLIRRNIHQRLHPNAVITVRLGDRTVSPERVSSISTFVILYVLITLFSCFMLAFDNLDAESTLGAVIAMLSNTGLIIGPGLGVSDSFVVFSQFSRFYMSILMIAGRLELLTIVLLFSPAFWRPYR
jgi:trk system potassium uptake protein TrkH